MPAPVNQHPVTGLENGDDEFFPDEFLYRSRPSPSGSGRNPALDRTTCFRKILSTLPSTEIASRLRRVIDFMASELSLDVTLFLHYLSWSHEDITSDPTIQYARTALMWSDELPDILNKWYRPPRQHGAGVRTVAAHEALEDFGIALVSRKLNAEFRDLGAYMHAPSSELSEESLLSTSILDIAEEVMKTAPTFWKIAEGIVSTPRQREVNTYKSNSTVRTQSNILRNSQFG